MHNPLYEKIKKDCPTCKGVALVLTACETCGGQFDPEKLPPYVKFPNYCPSCYKAEWISDPVETPIDSTNYCCQIYSCIDICRICGFKWKCLAPTKLPTLEDRPEMAKWYKK